MRLRLVEPIDNRVALLILQHPQEQDRLLGTARLTKHALQNAELKIGLSWPSLAKALGRDANPSDWAVLHLGAAHAKDLSARTRRARAGQEGRALARSGQGAGGREGSRDFRRLLGPGEDPLVAQPMGAQGQATGAQPQKTIALRQLRREPRREALSTLEAAALALSRLEKRPEVETFLLKDFAAMLDKYHAALSSGAVAPPAPARRGAPPRRRTRKPPSAG